MNDITEWEKKSRSLQNQMEHLESQIDQDNAYIKKIAQAVDDLGRAMDGVKYMQGDQLSRVREQCVKGIDPDQELLGKLKLTSDDILLSDLNSASNTLTKKEEALEAGCRAAQKKHNSIRYELNFGWLHGGTSNGN